MSNRYTLVRIDDLLAVPAERRHQCLDEIEMCLLAHELAFGDKSASTPFQLTWVDDGANDITVGHDLSGREVLKLEVFKP